MPFRNLEVSGWESHYSPEYSGGPQVIRRVEYGGGGGDGGYGLVANNRNIGSGQENPNDDAAPVIETDDAGTPIYTLTGSPAATLPSRPGETPKWVLPVAVIAIVLFALSSKG
jgi:hypothetical protein